MSESEDACGLCLRPIRGREKSTKSIQCKKCVKQYHVKCSGLESKRFNEVTSKKIPWFCETCKRASLSRNSMARAHSVSDEGLNNAASNASPEDVILLELEKVESHLTQVKEATKKIDVSVKNGENEPEKQEKLKIIADKICELEREIEIIKGTVREQEKKVADVVVELMEQRNDNVKLKAEIASVQISLEAERQRNRKGALIICGLPRNATVNAEQVYTNICQKLEIDPAPTSAPSPTYKMKRVVNKSVGEQRLEVSNLGVERSALIIKKYREARKKQNALTSGAVMDGGDSKPLYINESLTGYFQLLFKMARDMRRRDLLKFVWTSGGVLFVRKTEKSKIYQIRHKNDLDRFSQG